MVAASVGPYGAFLADGSEYRGDYGVQTEYLEVFHIPRIALFCEENPDVLACETVPCYDELLPLPGPCVIRLRQKAFLHGLLSLAKMNIISQAERPSLNALK